MSCLAAAAWALDKPKMFCHPTAAFCRPDSRFPASCTCCSDSVRQTLHSTLAQAIYYNTREWSMGDCPCFADTASMLRGRYFYSSRGDA